MAEPFDTIASVAAVLTSIRDTIPGDASISYFHAALSTEIERLRSLIPPTASIGWHFVRPDTAGSWVVARYDGREWYGTSGAVLGVTPVEFDSAVLPPPASG